MKFYHHGERLVVVGETDDGYVKRNAVRVEVFEIANDEQLCGCELYEDKDGFTGVTWIKIKQPEDVKPVEQKGFLSYFGF